MTTHDNGTNSESNGEDERQQSGEGAQFGRRDFLKSSAAAGLATTTGFSLASGSAAADHRGCWSPGDPPIQTPWFDDVSPSNAHPEYPRPQMTRDRWQNLNGEWGFEPVGGADPFGRTLDECILVPYPVESALSGLERGEDHVWYRETFTVPSGWDVGGSERLLLHFEAVDWETTVYVNGQEVGFHRGGFDHFSFDVSDYLSGGEEELVVEVRDPTDDTNQVLGKQRNDPGGIFYTSATGIWQTVWMEPVPNARVDRLDTTPDVANGQLAVTAEATNAAGLTVEAVAFDDAGNEVGSATGSPGSEFQVPVPSPTLWSPDNPSLYDLEVSLLDGGTEIDSVSSYFGMRSVGVQNVDGDERITLNGEPVFNMATLDQGYWPDGIYTPPTDEALRYDLQRHKDMGFNTVRKHTKLESRRWFYHADQLGLLVWQDMPSPFWGAPDSGQAEQFEYELRRMIDQVGNHPSVNVWVPFNEGWGDYDISRIVSDIESLDGSRLIDPNSGHNVGGGDCGCGEINDVHNYVGPGPAPDDARAGAIGEFGGIGLKIDGHLWNPDEDFSYAGADSVDDLTNQYIERLRRLQSLRESEGVTAGVWTQITDVETEINGLITYDRQVDKVHVDQVYDANQALIDGTLEGAADGTAPVSDATYEIENVNSGDVMDVEGRGTSDGDNVQQWPGHGGENQQWTLDHLGNGRYSLQNVNSGKYLSVEASSTANDANVWQWAWENNPDQKWVLDDLGGGEFRLTASHSGRVAEVYAGETADGATVQQYDWNDGAWQHWRLNAVDLPLADGTYEIENVNSGDVLDVDDWGTSNGDNVIQWPSAGGANQHWNVTHLGSGQYQIQNVNSGLYLSVEGSSTANDANVWQWAWEDNPDQKWALDDLGNGEFRVSPSHTNRVMEVLNGDTADGTNVQQYDWNGGAWQKWRFNPV